MFKLSDDSAELYETKAEAIERACMLMEWYDYERIMVQRDWAPGWLAALTQGTRFDWIAWEQVEGSKHA